MLPVNCSNSFHTFAGNMCWIIRRIIQVLWDILAGYNAVIYLINTFLKAFPFLYCPVYAFKKTLFLFIYIL